MEAKDLIADSRLAFLNQENENGPESGKAGNRAGARER